MTFLRNYAAGDILGPSRISCIIQYITRHTGERAGMTVVTKFPKKIREIETLWIPLADGTQLAARVWMPEDAEQDPVSAILEYIPYRRRDGTRDGDDLTHPYFAGHGYACVRLDIRGSG